MFDENDRLMVKGKNIVNRKGEAVMLRGINFGGWLHREGWMDGGGACVSMLPVTKKTAAENSAVFELPEVLRCNRIFFSGRPEGEFVISASLDGANWTEAARGNFGTKGESKTDNLRPAPYAPGVNVYDEGVFVQDDAIHTNEFFARFIRIEAQGADGMVPARYGDTDDFSARRILEERFGSEKAEELLDIYQKCYITEADLEYIKSLGFNFVRIPVYWEEIMTVNGKIKDNAWDDLDLILERCREMEIYAMPDYHAAPGGNTMGSITAGRLDYNELWDNETYWQMSMDILKAMAERYKDHPEIACIDLLNEPCVLPPPYVIPDMTGIEPPATPTLYYKVPERLSGPVRRFYRDAYKTVRDTGDEHILCMQQFADIGLIPQPETYGWENVIYQIHCYPVGNWRDHDEVSGSVSAYLETIRTVCKEWSLPTLAGEFCCWEFDDVWEMWMKGLTDMGIHWSSWSYKIADPVKKDHWSIFYDPDVVYVDYFRDSAEEIADKWSRYGTENYKKNEALEDMLGRYARI